MPDIKTITLQQLAAELDALSKRIEKGVQQVITETASEGVRIVENNVPVAFGELKDSIEHKKLSNGDAQIRVTAPHAAAAEIGSRPHWPDIDKLERWVKLRGMQGLSTHRGKRDNRVFIGSNRRTMTPKEWSRLQARRVRVQIQSKERGGAVDINEPRRIAFQIARKISKSGTEPFFYTKRSLPAIFSILKRKMAAAKARGWGNE